MVIIRNITNPFKVNDADVREVAYSRAKRLCDYMDGEKIGHRDKRIIVTGIRVTDLSQRIEDGDEIIITPEVKAPVVAAVSFIVSAVWAAAVAHPFLTAFFILSVGYSIYQYMNQPKMPDFNLGSNGLDEGSPTYGWDGVQTIQEVGVPVAVVYGEHRVGGNIINQFVWEDGNKSYLNVLLALCEGEIESIDSIEINSNPIDNFEGVEIAKRFGTNDQSLISNFEDLHNIYPVGANLTRNNSYVYTTVDSDVEGFEIHLGLNNGLYQQDASSGDIKSWSVAYRVEYKPRSSSVYIDLGVTVISEKSRTAVRRVFRKGGLAPDKYDIRVTRTSEDSSLQPLKQGDLALSQIDEIKTDDLSYPNTALLGLRLLATDQLSGSMPNITCVVKGRKVLAPDIRNAGEAVGWEDYYWDGEDYRFLSNDALLSWDGESYQLQYCANPVWCLRDLSVSARFGLGEFIADSHMHEDLLLEMSRYCEERVADGEGGYEKRFRLDVVIDSNTKALDVMVQLCAAFNAMPVYSAGGLAFKIDKPTLPTQLFGMGNIIKDSFVQNWKTLKEVPNVIEVQFTDREKNYHQETIAYIDEESLALGEPMRKAQVRLFTTRASYAIRAARYALKVARYVNRSITFKAGIDAVACQAGDVISISHDVPQWGYSGRIKEGSTSAMIRLDQDVVIEDDKSYAIQARYSDDTIEERTVTSPAGVHSVVSCEGFSRDPEAFDVYALGETHKVKKDFRVASIQREGRNEVQILALEYNELVYDDSDIVMPQNNYSALTGDVPAVSNLVLTERVVRQDDGTLNNMIDVWWTKPVQAGHLLNPYVKGKIFVSQDSGQSWQYAGESYGSAFTIAEGVVVGNTYSVAVVSVGMYRERSINQSPQESITVYGKGDRPNNVTGFRAVQDGNDIVMTWNTNQDADLKGYEIREGDAWDRGVIVASNISGTLFRMPVFGYGERRYMIKAVDTSGNLSLNEAVDVVEISGTVSLDNVQEDDLLSSENGEWRIPSDENEVAVVTGTLEPVVTSEDMPVVVWTFGLEPKRDILDVFDSLGNQIVDSEDQFIQSMSQFEYFDFRKIDEVSAREGIYISSAADLGAVLRARLNITLGLSGEQISYALFIATSADGETWSDWMEYGSGEYVCRYYRIKVVLRNNDVSLGGKLTALRGFATIQYYEEEWPDVEVEQTRTILFRKKYYVNVAIGAIAHGDKYIRVSNKSLQGCLLEVRDDATGMLASGVVDLTVKGY